jgi:metallo-beta-lactamase class B
MKNKILGFQLVFMSLFMQVSFAQVTITVNNLPANTPISDDIYIAGDFNNWNPGDATYKLVKTGSSYAITLPSRNGEAQYKFTRGSWPKVESTIGGTNIANRTFTYSANLSIENNIAGWLDLLNAPSDTGSTALNNVSIISNSFYMPQLNRSRRVWIYLPSDYKNTTTKRYPVMYMQDGQNLFDAKTSFSGEWGVDESLVKLEKSGDLGCIIVGIDNGGVKRINEYSPHGHPQYGSGEGKAYVNFLAQTLKPFIDSVYRTYSDPKHTAIAGSSLGANISLFAALSNPQVFGKVGLFSPALYISDSLYDFAQKAAIDPGILAYYVAGSNESATMVSNINKYDDMLRRKGFLAYNSSVIIHADGAHSEWYWKREFAQAYQYLFNDVNPANLKEFEGRLNRNTNLVPNPASDYTEIKTWPFNKIKVLTDNGKEVFTAEVNASYYKLDVSGFENGTYYVEFDFGRSKITKKLMVLHK